MGICWAGVLARPWVMGSFQSTALQIAHYNFVNFVRRHGSLRVTPAMAAGVTQSVWGPNTSTTACWATGPRDRITAAFGAALHGS